MQRCMLLSKIHRAVVSAADLDYEGSLTVPPEVMEAAGFLPHEVVHVANIASGKRFPTYAIAGSEPAHFGLDVSDWSLVRLNANGAEIQIDAQRPGTRYGGVPNPGTCCRADRECQRHKRSTDRQHASDAIHGFLRG